MHAVEFAPVPCSHAPHELRGFFAEPSSRVFGDCPIVGLLRSGTVSLDSPGDLGQDVWNALLVACSAG